jgi:hypothetical protein
MIVRGIGPYQKGFLPYGVGQYFNSITPIQTFWPFNSELPRPYKIDPFHFGEYAYLILSNQTDTAEENAPMLMTSSETEANPGSKTRMGNLPLRQCRFRRFLAPHT